MRSTFSGAMSVIRSMEQRTYTIPHYLSYTVNLLDIIIQDEAREHDTFLELKPNNELSMSGIMFVRNSRYS